MIDLLVALSLMAQPAPSPTSPGPPCAAMDAALPNGLAAWSRPGQFLTIGAAVRLLAAAPLDPPVGATNRSGLSATRGFTVAEAGTYAIALDQPGWIDVMPLGEDHRPGAALHSVAHGHGPACSTIRKIVRFELAAGHYALWLSGLQRPEVRVLLVAAAAAASVPTEGAHP